jgi:hypothetical protein
MAFLASPASRDPGAVLGVAMRLGEATFRTMALLDRGHTSRWVVVWAWNFDRSKRVGGGGGQLPDHGAA